MSNFSRGAGWKHVIGWGALVKISNGPWNLLQLTLWKTAWKGQKKLKYKRTSFARKSSTCRLSAAFSSWNFMSCCLSKALWDAIKSWKLCLGHHFVWCALRHLLLFHWHHSTRFRGHLDTPCLGLPLQLNCDRDETISSNHPSCIYRKRWARYT